MFSFTTAANDTSRRADPVADLDRGPYVPGPIGPSVILNAYNVYSFAYSNGVRHTFIGSVGFEFLKERHVGLYILPVREIRGIAYARPGRAIAFQLDAVHAKILEIERVPLVVTREIGIAHQTNYD